MLVDTVVDDDEGGPMNTSSSTRGWLWLLVLVLTSSGGVTEKMIQYKCTQKKMNASESYERRNKNTIKCWSFDQHPRLHKGPSTHPFRARLTLCPVLAEIGRVKTPKEENAIHRITGVFGDHPDKARRCMERVAGDCGDQPDRPSIAIE